MIVRLPCTNSWIAPGIFLGRIEYDSRDDDPSGDIEEGDGTDLEEFMELLHNAAVSTNPALVKMAIFFFLSIW